MTRQEVKAQIEAIGIVPSIRVSSAEDALFAADAVYDSGIPIVEVTMTVPGALDVVSHLVKSKPDLIVGAGTILGIDTAQRCLDAGAVFLTSTGLDLEIMRLASESKVVMIPGALTPTEIILAWKAGADFVKVFPCSQVGGASYIKALKKPLPQIPMIASGGVNQQTATEFIHAGAIALGIGKSLIPPEAIARRRADWIGELSRRFLHMVHEGRAFNSNG